ncbi:hypothetical protein Gotri_022801 [Gossypium trilobum]|uniref:Uncharacterized protein n=1 Tax=Gossypium trilobum TaxID=34281 RepID=A0A7J9DH23_9ROSI|nr:hypothetical protein [Gossypium trilobum]
MACLSCSCISIAMAKTVIHPPIASLTDKPSPQETQTNSKPKTATRPRKRRQRLRQQKSHPPPSIVQIERAIGAGSFRDADSRHIFLHPPFAFLWEQRRKTIFDGLLPVTGGKFEGDIEKKLRETGEWIGTTTEATFRSSGTSFFSLFSFNRVQIGFSTARKNNPVGCATMDPTNLDLFSTSCFWGHKATIQHPPNRRPHHVKPLCFILLDIMFCV